MIAVGARIGPFSVIGTLGAGGMGQVYRARDSRLNREVAIKVLPPEFAADPESMARFSREAQLLAALSHPNIAVLYGLEETGGTSALVMELVEGQTLAHRIAAGPLPLDEAVAIARQIAEALEAAHDKGIVHRDLKPSNVKIDPQGKVKVLDFGLAKGVEPAPTAGVSPTESPTLVGDFTRTGVIMGTAAYMSPEQARGKTVDKRADIWAFGVLLYEMLTGRPMFLADTVAETLASVLRAEIDLTHLPIDTPQGIRRLIRRCLQRDPKQRLRDIGDARIELDAADDASPPAVLAAPAPARRSWLPWITAGALAIAVGGFAVAPYYREQPQPAAPVRFLVSPPEKVAFGVWLAVSPDGRHIAFPGTSPDGITRIWVRSLNSVDTRPIADAEAPGTITLFWSSDSRSVVFASAGKVKRIAIDGGPAQTLCDAPPVMLGGSWNAAGTILMGSNSGPIMRVSAAGGSASPVTVVERSKGEMFHSDPLFLPDGTHFLYFRHSSKPGEEGVYVASLEAKPAQQSLKRIVATDYSPAYAPPLGNGSNGQLLFLREGTLLAQPFDQKRLELMGEAVPVAQRIGVSVSRGFYSVSTNGVLAYREVGGPGFQIGWYDREGRTVRQALEDVDVVDIALSPDGSRIAYSREVEDGKRQIWILDTARRTSTRFSFAPESVRAPVWSPDGKYIAFSTTATHRMYMKEASGGGDAELLREADGATIMNDWSRDGRFLLFTLAKNSYDIWALSNPSGGGERKAFPVADTEFSELHGQISPDSRWVAYDSTETGKPDVFVQPFPPGEGRAGKWVVSSGGGLQPRWRADGREIFYLGADRSLMAVDIQTSTALQAGLPHRLFSIPGVTVADTVFKYDVTRDGKTFVMVSASPAAMSMPMTVVLNWQSAQKR